jgi:hypothetical protein
LAIVTWEVAGAVGLADALGELEGDVDEAAEALSLDRSDAAEQPAASTPTATSPTVAVAWRRRLRPEVVAR